MELLERIRIACKKLKANVYLDMDVEGHILANWILTPFENAIISKWNPTYYGRYVDDVIIVDKVEKNSPLYHLARTSEGAGKLSSEAVLDMLLTRQDERSIGEREILVKEKPASDQTSEHTAEQQMASAEDCSLQTRPQSG